MLLQQALCSSPSIHTYTYDVFLSFRGIDTRIGFTGNLYSALSQRGVLTFIDDDGLRKGEEISPSLRKAIQKSRMAIIIFSKNYASSIFCLNELVDILECYAKQKMWVLPIFYDVDPSQVRHQTRSYQEAFAKHEHGRFKDDMPKVQKWRLALRQAANLSGLHFKFGDEYEYMFIRKIIKEVSCVIKRPPLHIAGYPVGLEARMKDVQWLMGDEFDKKVTMLGIHGIGGVGKSTLGRAIYNSIAHQFEGSYFLANVREDSTRHGLVQIQETVLSELVGEKNIKLSYIYQGIPILQERLQRKKVLLVIDDVDEKEQLEAIAGGLDWFCAGSIIIIITRDKHLLDIHGVEKLYEVQKLNDTEALELFRWHAFKNKEVDPSYMDFVKDAINYASGLPLALETIGSNLFGKTLDEWESALEAYEKLPNKIQEILRVSYDGLEENEKEIFLDIACFFKGCTVRYVTNMLQARGFHGLKHGIRVLEEKSLIKTLSSVYYFEDDDDDNDDDGHDKDDDEVDKEVEEIYVTMHDFIQCMGKEIVTQQSNWPEKRNRVWLYGDAICVLEKNKENHKIQAMMLDMPEDEEVQWNQEVFRKMKNLEMLIVKNAYFVGSPEDLPGSLRVLEWWRYPGASLPSNFQPRNLVLLKLSYSSFQWDQPLQKSKVLRHLIFTGCKSIRQIPDVSGSPNLTELCVDKCTNLIEIHDSVGLLQNLQRFSAKRCTKLRLVPRRIKLKSLEYLCLRDCINLTVFPEIVGPMEKLKVVDMGGTAIENLPPSMRNLKGLQTLSLKNCKLIESNEISNIIEMSPHFFPMLTYLYLQGSNVTIIPECTGECSSLESLYVHNCKQLQEVRGLPPKVPDFSAGNTLVKADSSILKVLLKRAIDSNRTYFYALPGKRIPAWFDQINSGNSLCFWFRKKVPSLTLCVVTASWDNVEPPFILNFSFYAKINDEEVRLFQNVWGYTFCISEADHIFIVKLLDYLRHPMNLVIEKALSENEWIYGKVSFVIRPEDSRCLGLVKWIGVYVNREFSRMEDIRFTDPYPINETCYDSCYIGSDEPNQLCEGPEIQQQQQLNLLNRHGLMHYESSNSDSLEPEWTNVDSSNVLDGAFLDHQAVVPGESSSGAASDLRIQTEITEDDDVDMEAFYDSLDAQAHAVSCPHDKPVTTTAPYEEGREALKIVQDFFISNDASVLLHPEQCSVVKTSLEYLSNLNANNEMSRDIRILIAEASRDFTNWSSDYFEASKKIESAAFELKRLDEVEAGLQTNRKQFREVAGLKKGLQDKLAKMEKMKEDLKEQLNGITANIFVSKADITASASKKKDIFEEAKILKAQRDKLKVKAPHLQKEHDSAKETQTRIQSEWSEIREKINKTYQA